MELKRLTKGMDLAGFDCGDSDLNSFLSDDAMPFHEKRIATSF